MTGQTLPQEDEMTFSGVSRGNGAEFPSKAFNRLRSMTSAGGEDTTDSGETPRGGAEIDTTSIRKKANDGTMLGFH